VPKPYFSDKRNKFATEEIVRVDHAGEYGARRIYEGQLKYIKDKKAKILIQQMLKQELEHLEYFDTQIKNGITRPTILLPLWNILGYGLGAISAKLGPETAMLITENVEEVIVKHYQEQIDYLEQNDKKNPLLKKIKKFQQDEAEHIHIAVANDSGNAKFNNALSKLVRYICRSAIFVSKKI
jgi:ubiquinone biosynthesis monooxygenase Coq7